MFGGGFADDAVVDVFVALSQGVDNAGGAVAAATFFVGGDEQGDAASVLGVVGDEALAGGNEAGDAGFHVGGAAAVEVSVALGGLEGGGCPLFGRAGGDDVGVAGEAEQGGAVAAPCPEVAGIAERQVFDLETDGLQALGDDVLAAVVVGGDGGLGDELFGESEGGGFGHGARWRRGMIQSWGYSGFVRVCQVGQGCTLPVLCLGFVFFIYRSRGLGQFQVACLAEGNYSKFG